MLPFMFVLRFLICGVVVVLSPRAYSEAAAAASPISTSKMVPREICQSYVQCRRELLERVTKCPGGGGGGDLSREITTNNNNDPRNRECSAAAKSKMQLLRNLQKQMQQQQLNCVQNRVNESVPIYPRKPRVCNQKVLDEYAQFVNTTLRNYSSTTATTPGNENGVYEKWMREVKLQNQQRRRRDRRNSSNSTTTSSSTSSTAADSTAEMRKRCADEVSEYQRQCAMLTKCCSEVSRCEDDLKSAPLYSEISQLHLDIFNQLRQCQEK